MRKKEIKVATVKFVMSTMFLIYIAFKFASTMNSVYGIMYSDLYVKNNITGESMGIRQVLEDGKIKDYSETYITRLEFVNGLIHVINIAICLFGLNAMFDMMKENRWVVSYHWNQYLRRLGRQNG